MLQWQNEIRNRQKPEFYLLMALLIYFLNIKTWHRVLHQHNVHIMYLNWTLWKKLDIFLMGVHEKITHVPASQGIKVSTPIHYGLCRCCTNVMLTNRRFEQTAWFCKSRFEEASHFILFWAEWLAQRHKHRSQIYRLQYNDNFFFNPSTFGLPTSTRHAGEV